MRSSNEEVEEDVGAEAKEEVQGMERQEAKGQMRAWEMQAPSRKDQGIRQPEWGASESIDQGIPIATVAERPITGAPTSLPNNKGSYICTSRPREKNLRNNTRGISS